MFQRLRADRPRLEGGEKNETKRKEKEKTSSNDHEFYMYVCIGLEVGSKYS